MCRCAGWRCTGSWDVHAEFKELQLGCRCMEKQRVLVMAARRRQLRRDHQAGICSTTRVVRLLKKQNSKGCIRCKMQHSPCIPQQV